MSEVAEVSPSVKAPEAGVVALALSEGAGKRAVLTAARLEKALNSGTDPENLAKGFVEGVYDWMDEDSSRENKGDFKKGKESSKDNERNETNDKKAETPDEKFRKAVEEHRSKHYLQANNLEGDSRYKNISERLIEEWLQANPEPYKGRTDLTEKQKEEWREWTARKHRYVSEKLPSDARAAFKKEHQEDFSKYEKYSVYDLLDSDPRYKEILARMNKIFANNPSAAPVSAINEFVKNYPEVVELYAIKDPEVTRLIELNTQRSFRSTSEKHQNNGSNSEELDDDGSKTMTERDNSERRNDKEDTGKNELQKLQEQVEALRRKLDVLEVKFAKLDQFEQIADQLEKTAGQVAEYLIKQNPNLFSEKEQYGDQEEKTGHFFNLKKLLELLGLMVAGGGLLVVQGAKAEK